jgi:hypothetical protein
LIFSNLTLPGWLVTILGLALAGRAGAFGAGDLDRQLARLRVQDVHRPVAWHAYESVFVK